MNTDNSFALRSLWEFFETTQFADQFFFVDACRDVPPWGEGAEFELGRWTCRERDPGTPPVQQFILYATSPKLRAQEVREKAGEEHGAFTAAVLAGLTGAGSAKAWSWSQQSYEVRWERLASYVKNRVEREKRKVADAAAGELLQIPQDTGSRGVAPRPRRRHRVLSPRRVPEGAPRGPARSRDGVPDRGRPRPRRARGRRGRPGRLRREVGRLLPAAGHVRAAGGRAEARGPGG